MCTSRFRSRLLAATVIGFLVALVVGLSTLRLRGVYFIIFTFGLTELAQQVLVWWEINQNKTMSRYIFANVSSTVIFEILLAIALLTVIGSWYVSRTRLGYALRSIGRGRDRRAPHRHRYDSREGRSCSRSRRP